MTSFSTSRNLRAKFDRVNFFGIKPCQGHEGRSIFTAEFARMSDFFQTGAIATLHRLFRMLDEAELSTGPGGKGRNVWICLGYVLASDQSRMVAVHDCDIVTYNRELLARLCYPVAHPSLGFDFCKGYYARVTDKLNGRVMRLLVTPMIRALKSILGSHPYLVYMDTSRYPLAGEFSLDLDLVRRNRIPADWGLEVGLLADVFRNSVGKGICQVELCENYDH